MLKRYIIVTDTLNIKANNDSVRVIPRTEYSPYKYEPIDSADALEDAIQLANKINNMGGANAYLSEFLK